MTLKHSQSMHWQASLSYPKKHGTAHRIGAELFAQARGRHAFLWRYMSVFTGFFFGFCVPGFLAGAAVLGARNAGARTRPEGQYAARKVYANRADHRLADQPGDAFAARRAK